MIDVVVWAQYINVTDTRTDSHVASGRCAKRHAKLCRQSVLRVVNRAVCKSVPATARLAAFDVCEWRLSRRFTLVRPLSLMHAAPNEAANIMRITH